MGGVLISPLPSMVSGACHTREAFDQLLQSLPAQLPGLSIDCRSDTDGLTASQQGCAGNERNLYQLHRP
jgi:hypothetical protein